MKQLRKFLTLDGDERGLLVKAWLLLGTIRIVLWVFSYDMAQRMLARWATASRRWATPTPQPLGTCPRDKVIWAIVVASRYLPLTRGCLTRALAAQTLLARRGFPAQVRFGVWCDESNRLQGHAWVECDGARVLGGDFHDLCTPMIPTKDGRR